MSRPASQLPLDVRTRLGRELAADLQGAYDVLLARGWSQDRALARARELVLPDDDALHRLAGVHRPLYDRLAERFSPHAVRRGERAAVVAVAAVTLAMLAGLLLPAGIFVHPSPFLLPVLACGSLGVAAVAAKAFHLFAKRPSDGRALRLGLATPLVAGGFTVLTGLGGALVDTYRFAAAVGEAAPTDLLPVVVFVGSTAVLLAVALGLALAGALGWFLLLQWIVGIEADAALFTSLPGRFEESSP